MPAMENSAKPEACLQLALAALEPDQPCLLAFSGGLDSLVLLHAVQHLRPDLPLRVAHVDHGLQAASAQWAQHCAALCQRWQLEFACLRPAQAPPSGNLEAWAREQRYALLQAALQADEVLLTAHHLRDQAETVLLNLLRGSGPAGLAAMPSRRALGEHSLLRPLLQVHPEVLQAYAAQHNLPVLEDPSNADTRFDRNFLRHQILPALEQRFPQVLDNMARSAALQAQQQAGDTVEARSNQPLADFLAHGPAWRNRRLYQWLRSLGLPPPRHHMLDELWQQLLLARSDAQPLVSWPGAQLRRYRDQLYAMAPLSPVQPLHWIDLAAQGQRDWPWGGRLYWELPASQDQWCISTPQGGERILLRGQHRRLKSLFQQAGIPPWQRERMPVLWRGQDCVAVGDRWQADNTPDLRFAWDQAK